MALRCCSWGISHLQILPVLTEEKSLFISITLSNFKLKVISDSYLDLERHSTVWLIQSTPVNLHVGLFGRWHTHRVGCQWTGRAVLTGSARAAVGCGCSLAPRAQPGTQSPKPKQWGRAGDLYVGHARNEGAQGGRAPLLWGWRCMVQQGQAAGLAGGHTGWGLGADLQVPGVALRAAVLQRGDRVIAETAVLGSVQHASLCEETSVCTDFGQVGLFHSHRGQREGATEVEQIPARSPRARWPAQREKAMAHRESGGVQTVLPYQVTVKQLA